MNMTLTRNDRMGHFEDDFGNVRGLWFNDAESLRNEMRLRVVMGYLNAQGKEIDVEDYYAVIKGFCVIKELGASAGGGYAIMFPSSGSK